VNRVTFEGTRAGGVEFKEGIHVKTAKANKEVSTQPHYRAAIASS
jgi:hypothetical protein